jgi:septal ring factor EnvC (AmiA/AmiB activator)
MNAAEKLSAMELDVSGLRSLVGETAASGQKAARDIDAVKAAVIEQRLAHGRAICTVEEEMGSVREAVGVIERSQRQQEDKWKAAIGDLHKKAEGKRGEVSALTEVLRNLEGKHEKLRETVTRQGDELAETCRRNEELRGRVQHLEEENQLLRESSDGLKGQLARTEAVQQSAVARLQDAIAAGGSKVNEDLGNVRRDLAKLKEDMMTTRKMITGKNFAPSMKKGTQFDVPDGIIAHLTRDCGGNVHDRKIVDVTCGSFETETQGANRNSGAYGNCPPFAVKNRAEMENGFMFRVSLSQEGRKYSAHKE